MDRRSFIGNMAGSAAAIALNPITIWYSRLSDTLPQEGLIAYVHRMSGRWDPILYGRLLGAANAFKEGDGILGLAANGEDHRLLARRLLAATTLSEVNAHPLLEDGMYRSIRTSENEAARALTAAWTFDELKAFLLNEQESSIHGIRDGLSSDVIGCLVKLMDNAELERLSAKLFNPLPGTMIGAKGYLGARIQPNSPTDHPEDIRWQVFNAWAFGVGDVLLGTNPVSSEPEQVHQVERTLQEVLATFDLEHTLPHCVLAHIDIQAEVERRWPGSTALWFQSIAGSDAANATFDVSVDRLIAHADSRQGPFGLYFETGQGADFTNGHGQHMDMVLHESRKYGLARMLSQRVAIASGRSPWVHLNDVAGFIGPEVFRTREQLIRCCLEDLVMGKLHGLCIGLDICSTLHMDVSLDDLDHCLEALAPAQPAYLMALPTKIDPMLGYLTTGYQDHVRLRERFSLRVDDRMATFFRSLGVMDAQGRPAERFGDTLSVFVQYMRLKGDMRSEPEIREEGQQQMAAVRARGVFLTDGHGDRSFDLRPDIEREIRTIYDDAKLSILAEFDQEFLSSMTQGGAILLGTRSADRDDYILHPSTGESLDEESSRRLMALRTSHDAAYDVQVVITDGLNALSLQDRQQLNPFLEALQDGLAQSGRRVAPQPIVLTRGRVRAGYQIGEGLFAGLPGRRAILHVIGERPGTGHRTFSVYITCPEGRIWGQPDKVDHDITRVVAGIARTALAPEKAAAETVSILGRMWKEDSE